MTIGMRKGLTSRRHAGLTADMAPVLPDCLRPQLSAVAPRMPLPPGTCDTHMHVFGEQARYPLDARRNYTPHVCTLDQYRDVMALCGIERAVLVQPSVYGSDNSLLLDALREGGPAFRGVAVPHPDASEGELAAMHAAGVRGVRLNLVNPAVLGIDEALALSERTAALGWHLQVQVALDTAAGEAALRQIAVRVRVPLVVDHMGRPAPGPAPRTLAELLATGRGWVKLSAPYRISRQPAPAHADLLPLVQSLVAANPERLLWASDWPHSERTQSTPHDADLVDLLALWVPDAAIRRRICVDNPARLYGTEEWAPSSGSFP
ncbi:MAG TPA: amidohydrolase family protein [Caldimonas sp.]